MALFPNESAAPKAPNKLIKKVPKNKLTKSGTKTPSGRKSIKEPNIEANKIGAPHINQWHKTLEKTNKNGGSLLRKY